MPIRPCGRHRVRANSLKPSKNALTRLSVLTCLAIATQGAIAAPASSPPSPRYEVPSGTLDDALRAFANQSNVQLLYTSMLVRGRHSSGLHGNHTLTAGLARLLAEHGLTAVAVNPNTYILQNAKNQAHAARASAPQPENSHQATVTELASVDVTGTRIPRTSLELSFPVTVITADDIKRSGRGTLYELLSEQPGLVGHHPIAVASESNNYPITPPAGASLYSLGPRGTLYLVDGKRIAPFGLASSDLGGVSDLNGIPLSFIDRIEILRGGASAIYGADAMAGTINIILKKDYAGSEVSTRHGISQRGDAQSRQASAILGMQTRSGGNLLFAANVSSQDELDGNRRAWHTTDQSRFGLPDDRRFIGFVTLYGTPLLPLPQCQALAGNPDSPHCSFDSARYRTLQPGLLNKSLYARWEQPLGNSISLYFSGLRSQSEQELQYPPIHSNIPITPSHPDYPKVPDEALDVHYAFYEFGAPRNHSASVTNNISIGLEGLAWQWNWSIALSHSDSRARSVVDNVFASAQVWKYLDLIRVDGSDNTEVMNAVRATIRPAGYYSVDTLEATSNRPLFDAPGGQVQIEVGMAFHAAHRRNVPDPLQVGGGLALASTGTAPYNLHDRDSAVFAELDLPLHRTLHTDLAIRLDHHAGFRTNASPRIGVKWMPSRSLLVRASLGQGYRAPSLNDERVPFDSLIDTPYLRASPQLLPCVQVEPGYCLVEYGVGENPHLRAEFSRSLTAGMVWAPTHGFNLSLDGYRILRTDEFGIADAFLYPSLFPDGLVRDANGVLYRANKYLANIGRSETQGWEFESNYLLRDDRLGEFSLRLAAHYLVRYDTSSIIQPKPVERAGHDTPKLTLLGNVKWRHDNWTTTLAVRHFGSSRAYPAGETCPLANRAAGKCANPSVTLFGLRTEYASSGRWTYSLGIDNLFDRQPVNYRTTWDGYNIAVDDVYGRYFTLATAYRF